MYVCSYNVIVCPFIVNPFMHTHVRTPPLDLCPLLLFIVCQMVEYKKRCSDLEAELAVQEIGAESNTQQVQLVSIQCRVH